MVGPNATRKVTVKPLLESLNHVQNHRTYRNDGDRRYSHDSKTYNYGEDTWSMRLFYILKNQYPSLSMEYTATYRGNAANECILKRMATGASFSAHLFHGAPDIMIKAVPLVIDCECIIENKSAAEGSYQSNSRLPNQSGQLIAYLHQLIVIKGIQMAIQMAIENTTSFPPLEAHGLYITSKKNPIVFFSQNVRQRDEYYCHILFSIRSATICFM